MDLVGFLVYLIVWGLILSVLWWGLGKIGLPEPFNKVATVLLVLLTVVVLLAPLLGYVSVPHLALPSR